MKILYFYQYFSTSEGAWGTRVYEFARNWVQAGHEVTVVTSIYSKSDLRTVSAVSRQNIEGIDVRVINVRIDNRQSIPKRILSFLSYAVISSWYALSQRADIVIASSGPITVGIPGLIARWLRGRKLVFEVRDLWPEGAVRMGILKNPTLTRIAYWFENICYRSSSTIVGLSPGIQQDIRGRFPGCQVECVTNAANLSLFSSKAHYAGALPPKSYAIYFGNIGQVNHSEYLLEAAKLLLAKGRADISILLVGEGQLKQQLIDRKLKEEISNLHFIDLMPKNALVGYVQNALASLIPLKPLPVFDSSSPNKLFESLAAGIPVIQNTNGWIKDFLDEERVGFTVDGNDASTLVEKLLLLKDNPQIAKEYGERASYAAKQHFDKDHLATKFLDILRSLHER